MDGLLLTKLVAGLVLPPGLIAVLLLGALGLRTRRPRTAAAMLLAATAALLGLSIGPIARPLIASAEDVAPLVPGDARLADREAIVVLGGGRRDRAPELGGPTVSERTLERIRYGARLQRETGLPLAVTGGVLFGAGPAEAELMARALREDFRVPVRWVEPRSRNTEENAAFTAALLARDGVRRIVLVSHASHLGRGTLMFRDQGLDVVAAPTAWWGSDEPAHLLHWLPSAGVLAASYVALHEWLGLAWYRLRR